MNKYSIYNGTFYTDDELMHYGVIGMKWGVRRARKTTGVNSVSRENRRSHSESIQSPKVSVKKGRKAVTKSKSIKKSLENR